MVAHTLVPATWEAEIKKIATRGQPQQKVSKTHFNQ
jgi:hypothetical protein